MGTFLIHSYDSDFKQHMLCGCTSIPFHLWLTYIITSTLKHVAADTHLGKERENLTWKL